MNIIRRRVNRRRQNIGLLIGATASILAIILFFFPGLEFLSAEGPMNSGHEDLVCESCHVPAKGTLLQQFQANLQYHVGLRKSSVDFGHIDVDSGICTDCHNNPADRHPIHRFDEPRFESARAMIAPNRCESCHLEHTGRRVTVEQNFCQNCHQDTEIVDDPTMPTHQVLIATGQWESCLQCHDFHGNHARQVETSLEDAIDLNAIEAYFSGGSSPYGVEKYVRATTR